MSETVMPSLARLVLNQSLQSAKPWEDANNPCQWNCLSQAVASRLDLGGGVEHKFALIFAHVGAKNSKN